MFKMIFKTAKTYATYDRFCQSAQNFGLAAYLVTTPFRSIFWTLGSDTKDNKTKSFSKFLCMCTYVQNHLLH